MPMDIEPEYNNGKPYYAGYPDFRFNLSHSGKYAAIVYNSEGIDVGIDIQEKRPYRPSLSGKVAGPKDTVTDILMLWTIKEAYSKLTGRGIVMSTWGCGLMPWLLLLAQRQHWAKWHMA